MYTESLTHTHGPSCRPATEPEELPWFGEPRIEDNYRAGQPCGYQVIGGQEFRKHFDTLKEAEKELQRRQKNLSN